MRRVFRTASRGNRAVMERGVVDAEAPAWARRQPGARHEIIPAAGHHAHQDNSEAFAEVLLSFLDEVRR